MSLILLIKLGLAKAKGCGAHAICNRKDTKTCTHQCILNLLVGHANSYGGLCEGLLFSLHILFKVHRGVIINNFHLVLDSIVSHVVKSFPAEVADPV